MLSTLKNKKNHQTRESESERKTYEVEKQQFVSQSVRESSSGAVDSQSEKIVVV